MGRGSQRPPPRACTTSSWGPLKLCVYSRIMIIVNKLMQPGPGHMVCSVNKGWGGQGTASFQLQHPRPTSPHHTHTHTHIHTDNGSVFAHQQPIPYLIEYYIINIVSPHHLRASDLPDAAGVDSWGPRVFFPPLIFTT